MFTDSQRTARSDNRTSGAGLRRGRSCVEGGERGLVCAAGWRL